MKRIAKLLVKVYPSAWRERYGEELQGLIDDRTLRTSDLLDVVWGGLKMQFTGGRLLRIALPCALAGVAIAALIFFTTPRLYISGTAMVLSSPGGSNGQTELANAESAQRQLIPTLARLFEDRDAMASIIERYNLYPQERTKMPLDGVIRKMQKAILVFPLSPLRGSEQRMVRDVRTAFIVQFEYPDPQVAQKVDRDLVERLGAENLKLAQASHSRQAETLTIVDAPNLPNKPMGQPLIWKCGVGLVCGLLCGLLLMVAGIGSGSRLAQP